MKTECLPVGREPWVDAAVDCGSYKSVQTLVSDVHEATSHWLLHFPARQISNYFYKNR